MAMTVAPRSAFTRAASGSRAPGTCGVWPSVMPVATIGSAYAVTWIASMPASSANAMATTASS